MAAPFRVKSVYEYSSPHEDDLNFSLGQVITVTDEEDPEWYGGEYVDDNGMKHEGIFPRNFVEKFEPAAPPRPTRTRTKKEPEASQPAQDIASPPPPPPVQQEIPPVAEPEPEPEIEAADEPIHQQAHPEPDAPVASEPVPSKPISAPAPVPAATATSSKAPPKPKPTGPPPVSEKPSSNSFRDRIAAFNKPAAPPVAPFKPSGLSGGPGSGFVKKPFVAPPPSRHAFIPAPQQAPTAKVYRRDEDPEIKEREAETMDQAEKAGLVPTENHEDGNDEDQPKPTSLKERIALLQKQQMEQAQRHAEGAAKKEKLEKPKKPLKKRESISHSDELGVADSISPPPSAPLERRDTEEASIRTSTDEPRPTRMPPPPRRKSSKGPAVESTHDGNEADMSGAGDTTEGIDDLTEREDSDGATRRASRVPSLPIHPAPAPAPAPVPAQRRQESEEEAEDDEVEEGEDDEDDMDPEVRRKEELRARMAKMSGGMGFHGMFGAPMPVPGPAPKKKKSSKAEQAPIEEDVEEATSPASRGAPPIPGMMALPGMGGPKKSDELSRLDEDREPTTRAPPPPVPTLPRRTTQGEEESEKDDDRGDESDTTPAPPSISHGM